MMDSIDKITTLFPKLKQQLLFLKEREKLFKSNDDNSILSISQTSVTPTNSTSPSSSSIESMFNFSTKANMNDQVSKEMPIKQEMNLLFPEEYVISTLPQTLIEDIESGALHKFGPHHTNRQVLIDAITFDLINKYCLFYPTHRQFESIGTSIVRKLQLPLTRDNISIWKDAVQTKRKRKRYEHKDHADVQQYQLKYSKLGSGRPVKKMVGETVQKDRQKQILLINYDDDALNNIEMKVKMLQDDLQIDLDTQLRLWQGTVRFRRKTIRDQCTSDIIEQFPGYTDAVLIFAEVKMTTGVDLQAVVRRQIPILIEKMTTTPVFITDSPSIKLIRMLCRQFSETTHHIYCSTAPLTPYPTLVFINDVIYVYVDFILIVSSTSPEDALGLLLTMYAIFELSFNKHSRSIRLLYSLAFGDKRFISNTMRHMMREKNIDIYMEQNRKLSDDTNSIGKNSTTTTTTTNNNPQPLSQDKFNSSYSSTMEYTNYLSDDNSKISTIITSNQSNNKVEETSPSRVDSPKAVNGRRGRPKKILTKIIIEKNKSTSADYNSDDDCQEDIIPLVDAKLHPVSRHATKRKRRC